MKEKKLRSKEATNDLAQFPFIKILSSAVPYLFSSFRYGSEGDSTNQLEHLPELPDVVAHLKLMKAEVSLNFANAHSGYNEETNEKNWQVFVTNAVRRFIVFVSCLKHAVGPGEDSDRYEETRFFAKSLKDNLINDILNKLLPPLDVLMVWHSFLLNPRAFYDHFVRNDFYKFANVLFPFYLVSLAIDNQTFEYNPNEELSKNYFRLLSPLVLRDSSPRYDLGLFYTTKFSMYVPEVEVVCPICKETLLNNICYTNRDAKLGFADSDFSAIIASTKCPCDFSTTITHDELRKRQMYSDSKKSTLLPGAYRNFSCVLSKKYNNRSCVIINDKTVAAFNFYVLPRIRDLDLKKVVSLAAASERDARLMLLIFRNYLNMNLIHLTISPPKDCTVKILEFSDDLVGMVARQHRFVQKMNKLDWLHSPLLKETIQESINRYQRFFHLSTQSELKASLVPTLDIDLIWHTHQLSTYYYFKDCHSSLRGDVIDHEQVERCLLDNSFEQTCKIYRQKYNEEYSICDCCYCTAVRANSRSTVGKIFKSEVKVDSRTYQSSPFLNCLKGLTHISSHNAIELPTNQAMKLGRKFYRKYSTNQRRDSGLEVSWHASSVDCYPWLYVVDPAAPVTLEQAYLFEPGTAEEVGQDTV